MAEMSEEEEFATKVFQNLILPRGPVSSVKIRTFKKFLSEGEKRSKIQYLNPIEKSFISFRTSKSYLLL